MDRKRKSAFQIAQSLSETSDSQSPIKKQKDVYPKEQSPRRKEKKIHKKKKKYVEHQENEVIKDDIVSNGDQSCGSADDSSQREATSARKKRKRKKNKKTSYVTFDGEGDINDSKYASDSKSDDSTEENEQTSEATQLEDSLLTEDKMSESSNGNIDDDGNSFLETHQLESITRLSDDKGVIVHIKSPVSLTFQGKALIGCLYGSADIFGFLLRESGSQFYRAYSSEASTHLTIRALDYTAGNKDEERLSILQNFMPNETEIYEKLCSEIDRVKSCLLIFKVLKDNVCKNIMSISSYGKLFKQNDDDNSRRSKSLSGVGVHLTQTSYKQFVVNEAYRKVVPTFCEAVENAESTPVYVLCGGQNSGKSSLARFMINSALNRCEGIGYLDCDLGQTEFTPPGCVAFTKVDQPLLGPPFTHQKTPARMSYVGATSPGGMPEHYMSCVQYVYEAYVSLSPRLPLIVNTMGWNEGLGLELLVDILRTVRPTLVIQLDGTNQNKNFPPITTDFVKNSRGWLTCRDDSYEHQLSMIEAGGRTMNSKCDRYTNKDIRMISWLAHMTRYNISPSKELWSSTPYEVPWESMFIAVCNSSVHQKHILYTFNATIVALCHVDKKVDCTSQESCPKVLRRVPVCECLGFGWIRSIDPDKRVFYINTSVREAEIQRVNCLLRGAVEIPPQIILNQTSDRMVPYVGNPKDARGASSVQPQRYKQRRKINNPARERH